MSQVRKSPDGFFIPKERIANFEHAEVDTSHPHAIVIRSPAHKKELRRCLRVLTSVVKPSKRGAGSWMTVAC